MKLETIIKDAEKMLGEEKELHLFKGLIMNVAQATKDTGEFYYVFDLKCLKNFGDDSEYGQSYNMYHMIVPSDVAKNIPLAEMKELKGNEVYVLAGTKASVRRKENSAFNNISFYVSDIKLSRKVGIGQDIKNQKVVNL